MKKPRKPPFATALVLLQDTYSKSAGRGGSMSLNEINEIYRRQIQANEESGEK